MTILKGFTLQSAADAFTQFLIDTNLTSEGKVGWQINNIRGYYENGHNALSTAKQQVSLILATRPTIITTFDEGAELARINWAVDGIAASTTAMPLDLIKEANMFAGRVTVQPNLYMGISSTLTTLTNKIYWEIDYEFVKLTDIELLRLLVAGA